jgi:hypothetical protein
MREFIQILRESYLTDQIKLDDKLVAAVKARLMKGSFYDYDMPSDESEFFDDVEAAYHKVLWNTLFKDNAVTIYRAELRPRGRNFGSVGIYWSFRPEGAQAIYGHDHGPEIHGGAALREIVFMASAPITSVDWIATFAANIAMPKELEITLKNNAPLTLEQAVVGNRKTTLNIKSFASNITQYDMMETPVNEVEIGGGVEVSDLDDDPGHDYTNKQRDLFRDTPAGEPELPQGYKLVNRVGDFWVAQCLKNMDQHSVMYVFIKDGAENAAGYIAAHKWHIDKLNYRHENIYQPMLGGKGLRVGAVYVREQYRGSDLSLVMYKWMLENVCDYLMADSLQTMGGVKIWKKLQSRKPFHVEVWNGNQDTTRKHRRGKDFDRVYDNGYMIPWVTIDSKLDIVHSDPYE